VLSSHLSIIPQMFAAHAVAFALAAAPAEAADAVAVEIGTFANPTYIAHNPARPNVLFVVERAGRIQVLRNEVQRARPFLDIGDIVLGPPDPGAGNEQGLLSMALAPDYEQSGLFYVAFTNNNWDVEIAEFKRSATSHFRADPASRREVLVIPHRDARNHNGGQLQFGPDGRLYISVGDGAGSPTGELSRNLNSLLGKILRIDPRRRGKQPYRIPRNNPFVGVEGRDEIFAYGLRNPWRFSFHGNVIAISDVGQGQQEEVNILRLGAASGVNFGWPQYEGNLVFDNSRPGAHPPTFPIFTYSHAAGGCAIIGGYVVRDANLPALLGRYLYGDLCTGEIRSFVPRVGKQAVAGDRPTGVTLPNLGTFGEGAGGAIYAAQISGKVWRFAPPAN
jgi:glucose/arabinose dehydrogenase